MIELTPVTLEGHGVRLEPLTAAHRDELANAAADGRLWELWFTVLATRGTPRAGSAVTSTPRASYCLGEPLALDARILEGMKDALGGGVVAAIDGERAVQD